IYSRRRHRDSSRGQRRKSKSRGRCTHESRWKMRSNHDAKPAAQPATISTRAGFTRREALQFAGATLALLVSPVGIAAPTTLAAVRIWPGTEYTRITLEAPHTLSFKHMML